MKFPGERTEVKEGAEECDCEDCNCGPGSCGPGWRPSLTNVLLWHAQRAKMELIQEKIKKAIEARRGKVYDKLAEALAEHLAAQAERAESERGSYDELDDRIKGILGRKEGKK